MILSADADFYELATILRPLPKVVWLRRWAHPARDADSALRRDAIRLTEFAATADLGILVLDRE
jgi:predicted nuclease of predicted toxin-antitoxin system